MSPYEAARTILLEAIGDVVGERIRPDRRYEDDALPSAAVAISEGEPLELLDGVAAMTYAGSVALWAATRRQADELAAAIQAADGAELADQERTWLFWLDGYLGGADLVAEESDRPEYRAEIPFRLFVS